MFVMVVGCVGVELESSDEAPAVAVDPPSDVVDSGSCGEPLHLERVQVRCDGLAVALSAVTRGASTGGRVFLVDSGSPGSTAEEHDLDVAGSEWCAGDSLERTLMTAAPDPIRNVASAFGCADRFDAPNVMTYAFAVFRGDELADCVVAGESPGDLVDGALVWDGEDPSFDLSSCRRGILSR